MTCLIDIDHPFIWWGSGPLKDHSTRRFSSLLLIASLWALSIARFLGGERWCHGYLPHTWGGPVRFGMTTRYASWFSWTGLLSMAHGEREVRHA
jgi:hypothetical protein